MSQFKQKITPRKKVVWSFQLKLSKSQMVPTKLKNLKQWKRLLRKLLKKLTNKESN